jgi:hypothetical protein
VNLLFLGYLSHFEPADLGNLDVYLWWWNWVGDCKKCSTMGLTWESGIFRTNFGKTRVFFGL